MKICGRSDIAFIAGDIKDIGSLKYYLCTQLVYNIDLFAII